MTLAAALEALLLGAVALAFGSFIAAAAWRYPLGLGLGGGRSRCPHCHETLLARDLVPVLSWVRLGGRCRACGAALGLYYPAVELAALGLGFWAWSATDGAILVASCGLAWVMLALAIIDLRYQVLPDGLTLPLLAAGLAVAWFEAPQSILDNLLGAVLGYAIFAAIAWLYRRVRGREGLGLGDAKLLAAAGAWVGASGLPSVVLIAALLGLSYDLMARFFGRAPGRAERVPFGPALALAAWIVWLYGPFQAL